MKNFAIREAFARLHNLPPRIKGALAKSERNTRADKGWSTNLSFRTYQALKSAGVME